MLNNYCYGIRVCFLIVLCGQGGVADDSSGSGSWSDDDDAFELGRPAGTCDLPGDKCAASDKCSWVCDPECWCKEKQTAVTSICDLYGYACAASDECDWVCRDWFFYPPFDTCSCEEKPDAAALEDGDGTMVLTPAWGRCHFYLGDACAASDECDWVGDNDEWRCIEKVHERTEEGSSSGDAAGEEPSGVSTHTLAVVGVLGGLILAGMVALLWVGRSYENDSRGNGGGQRSTYEQLLQTKEIEV